MRINGMAQAAKAAQAATVDADSPWRLDPAVTERRALKEAAAQRRAASTYCYTLQMVDTYGDGWNGAGWTWTDVDEGSTQSGTLSGGSAGSSAVCADNDYR